MTGHNHHDWCTCGWCTGGSRNSGGSSTVSYAYLLAKSTLAKYGVKSSTACFVNPNANCPVCGEQVYFYSNDYGSRVYFDELGPPWTKHGCTIQDRHRSSTSNAQSSRPEVRPEAERKALIEAAECVGLVRGQAWNATRPWELFVVTKVSTNGSIVVYGESLSGQFGSKTHFEFIFKDLVISIGDLFSKRNNMISFVRRDNLEPVEIKNGGKLLSLAELAIETQKIADAAEKRKREINRAEETKKRKVVARENERKRIAAMLAEPNNRARVYAQQKQAQQRVRDRVEVVVKTKTTRNSPSSRKLSSMVDNALEAKLATFSVSHMSKYDMTYAEARHFHSNKCSVSELCKKLEPIIKGYARVGIRTPLDVATRLNSEGHRTANDHTWTERLAFFLLCLIFPTSRLAFSKYHNQASSFTSSGGASADLATDDKHFSQDELERRLSALGRVTKRNNQ